jgi:hypothetical protein
MSFGDSGERDGGEAVGRGFACCVGPLGSPAGEPDANDRDRVGRERLRDVPVSF